jgi:predicted amidohydrolase YtcJ
LPNPDLILYNGRIHPGADSPRTVEAIAVWNGLVTSVGSDREIRSLKAASVETVNLRGRTVIPGLSDSHIHLLGYGMMLRTLDLSRTRSISEIQKVVATASEKRQGEGWIVGRGWDQEKLLEKRYPNKGDFATIHRPVFLRRICGHIATANAEALTAARISKDTIDPVGGIVERDPSSGEPTGVLKEKAQEIVLDTIPQTEQETEEALVSAARRLLRVGLTSLHCIIENSMELRVLQALKSLGRIRQSIYAIIPLHLLDNFVGAGLGTERGSAGFRIGGVKMYLDGSLGARTAALTEPYSDDSTSGMLTMTKEALDEAVGKATHSGFQLSIHAIGDRAVEEAVSAIERAELGKKGVDSRHRVEHSSVTPAGLLSRMRRAGIVASVQPRFISSDTWAKARLGPLRVRHLYPFRSMLKAGITLCAGSDGPVEDPDPFLGVWAAVARPGLDSDERLSVGQALACYTTAPAYASFCEDSDGTLTPGSAADMVILDRDPFQCSRDDLQNVRVLETFVGGQRVFKRNPAG